MCPSRIGVFVFVTPNNFKWIYPPTALRSVWSNLTVSEQILLCSPAKEGFMNRLISLLLILLVGLLLSTRTFSKPQSDEETIKNLEMEGSKHAGFGDSDVAFQKTIMGSHETFIDPLGHVYDQTPADMEKMVVGIRTANPDAKATIEISDVKVRISGDTATALYHGTYTTTGFKEPNANVPGAHFVTLDTWQKQSGKWKIIGGAAVSTEPIPAEAYKTPAPGSSN
jgi:hypothetical protein